MCFYFIIIFFGKKNKCVGGKPASTYDYFSFWGRSLLKNPKSVGYKKMRNYCLSPTFDSSAQHFGFAR